MGTLLTTCTLAYSLLVPLDDYCKVGWVVAYYGGSFLNLVLGIVQASNIAILGTRLHF